MELKKYKLGDVATIIVGYPFESERFNTEGKGILLVRGMNVSERLLRFGEEARWWDEITDKYLPYYLQENDVLIGMDGSKVGKNFAIVKKEDLPLLLVQRVACIRAKSGFDQHFIWQYVSSPRFIEYVNTIKTGSSIPHISGSQIANFPIFAPSFEIQTRIGSLLSNLDRKIALNRAINRYLEALAKQLYDYWFVQFDFPDENGRPYKSSGGKLVWNEVLKREVPEGWTVSSLAELGYFKNGINYSKDEIGDKDYKIVNVRNISSSSIFIDNSDLDVLTLKRNGGDNYLVKESDILIARSGVPGATRLLREVENNIIYCGFIICYTISDLDNKPILFYTLKQLESVTKSQSNGSILSNISQDVLKQLNVVLPDLSVKGLFNEKINKMFSLIQKNQREIDYLTKLRDELLSLLMNGQLTIE